MTQNIQKSRNHKKSRKMLVVMSCSLPGKRISHVPSIVIHVVAGSLDSNVPEVTVHKAFSHYFHIW